MSLEVFVACDETAADHRFRNVVAALTHALGHAGDGGFCIGQSEEKQADPITLRAPELDGKFLDQTVELCGKPALNSVTIIT